MSAAAVVHTLRFRTAFGPTEVAVNSPAEAVWYLESAVRRASALADLLFVAGCQRETEVDAGTLSTVGELIGEQAALATQALELLDARTLKFHEVRA